MATKTGLLKVIRKQCVECMGRQSSLIEGCSVPKCSLFPYRMGSDPSKSTKRKGYYSYEYSHSK